MMMEKQDVPVIVCFNKVDLAKEKELKLLEKVYENCGHIVRFISVKEEEGIERDQGTESTVRRRFWLDHRGSENHL